MTNKASNAAQKDIDALSILLKQPEVAAHLCKALGVKVSSATRQVVPEGETPQDLPVPVSLSGVRRRPMPLGKLTQQMKAATRKQFRALERLVMAKIESAGLLSELNRDAADSMRSDAKAAVGQGGRPLDPTHARQISRFFNRGPIGVLGELLGDVLDDWSIQTSTVFDERYRAMYGSGGGAAQRRLGVKPNFRLRNPQVLQSLTSRANLLTGGIADDVFDRLRTVVAEEFYINGQGPAAVARELRKEFAWLKSNKGRSETIARTETLAVVSEAQQTVYQASGVEFKRWLTTLDGRERTSHFAAHGQIRKIDEPFLVGGVKLMQPGDPGGTPASELLAEIINCRCDTVAVIMPDQQFNQSTVWDGDLAPDAFLRDQVARAA